MNYFYRIIWLHVRLDFYKLNMANLNEVLAQIDWAQQEDQDSYLFGQFEWLTVYFLIA